MSMKKVYSCNICIEPTTTDNAVGVRFTHSKNFDISPAAATDGTHICLPCARMLRDKLAVVDLGEK